MTHHKYSILSPLLALVVTACGGGNEEPAPSTQVQKIDVTSVTLSHTSLKLKPGTSQQLTATVTPSNATDNTISWVSSSTSVATVSSTGLVTAIADGAATITATAGGKSTTCEVSVASTVIYDGENATIDLSTVTSVTQLQNEIKKANEQGVTNYKIVGECKNLGITSGQNATNVFKDINATVIDMSQVTGWPAITKSAMISTANSEDAPHMTETLPGVPAEFFYNTNSVVKELILPAEVQALGRSAFSGMSSLEKLTAPGVKVIGEYALLRTSVAEISFPNATTLGRSWIGGNNSIETVYLPSVTYMGILGMSQCERLRSVSMPKLEAVSHQSFYDNPALTYVNLPAAKDIGGGAFLYCTALASIDLPSAETLGLPDGTGAFEGCTSLSSIAIPNAKIIGRNCFHNCSALKEISLPSATELHKYALNGCSSLSSINLPLVTHVGEEALSDCENLKSISLPNATEIGTGAISNNPCLQTLSLTATGSISFGEQNFTFISSDIDLILNSNKRGEVIYGMIWKDLVWRSISYR